MKRGIWRVVLLSLVVGISFSLSSYAAIYLGVTEGYIFAYNGSILPGATVNVSVDGCSSSNCEGSATSDSGGYYVIGNLDLNAGGTVTSTAIKGNAYGSNTGTADQFQAAFVNVTTCEAPSAPTIVSPPTNTHNNSLFIFNWTSGTDPNSLPVYDVWTFDSISYNDTAPPRNKTNLAYGSGGVNRTYSWGVKTCNSLCCSPSSSSSFVLINNLPAAPTLEDVPNGVSTSIVFNWSNVTDADGDSITYDFYLDGSIDYSVSKPITQEISTGSHTWGARACDGIGCSSFSYDTFSIINNPPSEPNITDKDPFDGSSTTFMWVSGVDPDNDTTHDEFQLSNISSFSTLIVDNNDTTSPYTVTGLELLTIYYWKVRTCDDGGACSSWVSDDFFTYSCPAATTTTTSASCPSPGGGSIVEIVKYKEVQCTIEWKCDGWGGCKDGKQTRTCINIGDCKKPSKKTEEIDCEAPIKKKEKMKKVELEKPKEVKYYYVINKEIVTGIEDMRINRVKIVEEGIVDRLFKKIFSRLG